MIYVRVRSAPILRFYIRCAENKLTISGNRFRRTDINYNNFHTSLMKMLETHHRTVYFKKRHDF